ncbi:MAG: nuclease/transposase family protein [Candidatus Dormibacteria bacterium]
MSRHLRSFAAPLVVASPGGARVRTRLRVDEADEQVLRALGEHLGSLAGGDLAERCREGRLDAKGQAASRRERKRALTAASSSRWAGAITRTSEGAFQLAWRNLVTTQRSLRARLRRIEQRLTVPAAGRCGRARGYGTQAERWEKQRRLQVLEARLAEVERRLVEGRVSICRGGRRLAKSRHNLEAAGLTRQQWHQHWEAERLFICADGEADKALGNETIRFHPDENFLAVKLPASLVHLANRPYGRYRLNCPVAFSYRGEDVAAQAASGAVRYDISFDPERDRWYLDASWKCANRQVPTLGELQGHRVLAVDVNAGHLAAVVVDPSGNPLRGPVTVLLALDGLATSTRDGHLRRALSQLIQMAKDHDCRALVIEDLDFCDAREQGRERHGRRPSRGRRAKSFRRLVAGIPTARFRDRLVQMSTNTGLAVVAVDPAYTSRWGAEHWLGTLEKISPAASGHHAAALVIGRRGLGQRARRRERCDRTRPEDRERRATNSAVGPVPAGQPTGLSGQRTRELRPHKARGQPHPRQRTQPAQREPRGDQVAHDRSGPPPRRDSVPLRV